MITAVKLNELITCTPVALTNLIQKSGHKKNKFEWCSFIGMTNSGEFCYEAHYRVDGPELAQTKVFVKYDLDLGQITAKY